MNDDKTGEHLANGFDSLNIGAGKDNGTSVAGLTEAALSRIAKPTAPANTQFIASAPSVRHPPSSTNNRPQSRRRNLRIHHISDHSLSLPRSVYDTSRAEKDARATIYAAVKRMMSREDIVVLDTGNYIKGWRYQLHCEAKALGTPSCVVHIATTDEESTAINDKRLQALPAEPEVEDHSTTTALQPKLNGFAPDDPYDTKTHHELLLRFEEPNGATRWDSPLFTVPLSDAQPPLSRIWEEMVEPKDKDGIRRVIRPNQATVLTPASSSDHLYILDRVTQSVLSKVQGYWAEHRDEGDGVVPIELNEVAKGSAGGAGVDGSGKGKVLKVHLPVGGALSVPALQRMRRQFIASHRQQMGGMGMVMGPTGQEDGGGRGGMSAERIGELFVDWLNDQFGEA